MRWRSTARLAMASLVVLAGCGGPGRAGESEGIRVVASTSILADVVSGVVGDEATVETLIPVGADAHDYEASSQQVAALLEADLVVTVGLGLEEGLARVLETAAKDGANVVELAPRLDPIPLARGGNGGDEEEHEGEQDHGPGDPHVWMDPVRMAEGAQVIAAELEEVGPGGGWQDRADAYAAELEEAHRQIQRVLATIPGGNRKLVTNHEALGYFVDRYEFEVVGVVIPGGSTMARPSSEELARLVEIMREEGVRVVFAETTQPTALAEAIAAEIGEDAQVVELYTESLGQPGSGADTLIGMLITNAERIAAALS